MVRSDSEMHMQTAVEDGFHASHNDKILPTAFVYRKYNLMLHINV